MIKSQHAVSRASGWAGRPGRLGPLVICLALMLFGSGCDAEKRLATPVAPAPTATAAPSQTFAIYLTDPEIPPHKLAIQSHLELAEEPILAEDDIISYLWATHEITLSAAAIERLQALHVPTSGKSFAVCVDGAPIYAGAFWVSYSSQSFDGVVIDPILLTLERPTIQIQLGYPAPGFYRGEDPRSDPLIRAALEVAGKLR